MQYEFSHSPLGLLRVRLTATPPPGASAYVARLGESYAVPAERLAEFSDNAPVRTDVKTNRHLRYVLGDDGFTVVDADGTEAVSVKTTISRKGIEIRVPLGAADRLYGLGERSGFLDKRGRSYLMWNTDEPFHHELRDPLYQSVPFFIHRSAERNAAVLGVFLDDPGRSVFDLGESDTDCAVIRTERYETVVYFMLGDTPLEVASLFSGLCGRHEMPPRWALGFQQCRYSYYPDSRVLEVAREFRRRQIPCDVIYLDIHYMDGYRVFTWDPERFPDPARLIAELHRLGFRVVTIVDPGVKIDPEYHTYLSGHERNAFARTADGAVYTGEVWPGPAVFPDFLRADVREWWAEQHHALFDVGVDGIWNDMNEPADFTGDFMNRTKFTPPSEVMLNGTAGSRSIDRYHNVYGQMMCDSCSRAFASLRSGYRPFMVTRAGYAGIQRYAAVWTGDNDSTWAHLAMMIPMLLNMGLSGIAFCGADVGGFQWNASGELFARWIQVACFTPFFRAHTAVDTNDHEPWSFGSEVEATARAAIMLRGRLLPYIYSLFDEYRRTGLPLLRPLFSHDPYDERLQGLWNQFLLGGDILVAPILEPEARSRAVYLPAGRWYRWDEFCFGAEFSVDGFKPDVYQGACEYLVDAPLDRVPVFVRAGAVIPLYAAAPQHDADASELDLELCLALFADTEPFQSEFVHYDDDRESLAYRDGRCRRERLAWSGPENLVLEMTTLLDAYPRRAHSYELLVYSPEGIRRCRVPAADGVIDL